MRNTISILSFLLLAFGLVFTACSKDDETVDPVSGAFAGTFTSSAHPTSGTASINEDQTILTLTDFKTDAGPDLNIWLVSDITNPTSDYKDLGDIKGEEGDFTYDLPENVDYTTYKNVVVWCVAFNVNFGYAVLVKQ